MNPQELKTELLSIARDATLLEIDDLDLEAAQRPDWFCATPTERCSA